jgi:predicted small lipoprotein YifL
MKIRATAIIACLLLAACGQKGALYIPDRANPVVVPATAAPATGATPATPAGETTDEERRQQQQPQGAPGNNPGN